MHCQLMQGFRRFQQILLIHQLQPIEGIEIRARVKYVSPEILPPAYAQDFIRHHFDAYPSFKRDCCAFKKNNDAFSLALQFYA